MRDYSEAYQQAQAEMIGSPHSTAQGLQQFSQVFSALNSPGLATQLNQLYAEDFYFNDTFKTLYQRDALVEYLTTSGQRLDDYNVVIDKVLIDGQDVFLRWQMGLKFKIAGRQVNSQSIGMTHLRFNAAGKVILHQDFWDGAHGFYRHIPIMGSLLEWIRRKI